MVDFELTAAEERVLGCLMEKEMATPEYYPLSLNALMNACNQKSNRNPIVSYDESIVLQALDGLKENHLAWQSNAARVPKYEQHFGKSLNLVSKELSVICLLLLRGPQTVGELRGRAERMYAFTDLEEVNDTLQALGEMGLIRQIPRQPGQKESRFVHLLSGEPDITSSQGEDAPIVVAREQGGGTGGRLEALEEETRTLREELDALKQSFNDFKSQFE